MTAFLKIWFLVTSTLILTAGLFVVLFYGFGMRAPWIGTVSGVLTMVFIQGMILALFRRQS